MGCTLPVYSSSHQHLAVHHDLTAVMYACPCMPHLYARPEGYMCFLAISMTRSQRALSANAGYTTMRGNQLRTACARGGYGKQCRCVVCASQDGRHACVCGAMQAHNDMLAARHSVMAISLLHARTLEWDGMVEGVP